MTPKQELQQIERQTAQVRALRESLSDENFDGKRLSWQDFRHTPVFEEACEDISWLTVFELIRQKDDAALGRYLREHLQDFKETAEDQL